MRAYCRTILIGMLMVCNCAAAVEPPRHRELTPVSFTAVTLNDAFWAPRLETNRTKTLPHVFQFCESTGRIANFAITAKIASGKFQGECWNDSDVYKPIEGASYCLAIHPDSELAGRVDDIVAKIVAAQQSDGYLNTFYTLAEPGKRWTNMKDTHELYCAGHLIEAAVANYKATGNRMLLDAAVKYADYIDSVFGPGKRYSVCGHEEIELALIKLYEATEQKKYLDLAQFFVDTRGDKSKREIWGSLYQDHMPAREQTEVVGHAVRAMYFYSGIADVAGYTGDRDLIAAMSRLWKDMVSRKLYITGGIGSQYGGESFGASYELPNESAYCETCASIGLCFWAHRMNLLHGDAVYVDVLERAIYNNILSGVSLDGTKFFYVNPLAATNEQPSSNGNFARHRQEFFACPCCPTNIVRFLPSLPGYVCATGRNGIYVNLYAAGTARVVWNSNEIVLTQKTKYPWDGTVKVTVEPQKDANFSIDLRIPGWCRAARIAVNGDSISSLDIRDGYAHLSRHWKSGDTIQLNLPMPVERMEANPHVEADVGRVAVQRGPIVYCFEAVDNDNHAADIVLPRNPNFTSQFRGDLLGGVTVITGVAQDGRKITAVPYYAWDHREPGDMVVWVRQQDQPATSAKSNDAWKDQLYQRHVRAQ